MCRILLLVSSYCNKNEGVKSILENCRIMLDSQYNFY